MKALLAFALVVLVAPVLAPYPPERLFSGYQYSPPMRPHVVDGGRLHFPFAYPVKPVDPIERRFEEDRSRRVSSFDQSEPWFLLGSDALGRDVFSRLLTGARLSLGLALLATVATLCLGALAGAAAAHFGGWVDSLLMRIADFVVVLPGIYVVLVLRGAMPVVLSVQQVFTALVVVLSLVAWPTVARGVRGILVVERQAEYAEAARALGASSWRLIARHLLPATRGFLGVQATLLVPAFVMAEATLSFAGLGFMPPTPSWGVMLLDAAAPRIVADAPWLLAPAAAIVITVAIVHWVTTSQNPPHASVSSTQVI